jgi:hypothetical protein
MKSASFQRDQVARRTVQKAQLRPRPFPLQNGHLLTKGEDLDSDVRTTLEEDAGGSNQGEDNWQHGPRVLT